MPFVKAHGSLQGLCRIQRNPRAILPDELGFGAREKLVRDAASLAFRPHRHTAQVAFDLTDHRACDGADHASGVIEGDKDSHFVEAAEKRFSGKNRIFVRGRRVAVLVRRKGQSQAFQNAVRMLDGRAVDRDRVN